VPVSMPQPVYADTQTRAITGDGAQTEGTYEGVPNTWAGMNLDDGDTSYFSLLINNWAARSWNMEDFVESYDEITGVTITVNLRTNNAGYQASVRPFIHIDGVDYERSSAFGTSSTIYVTYSHTWAENPKTGGAWTAAAINAAEFGADYYGRAARGRSSYFYVTITYVATDPPTVSTSAASGISYNGTHHSAILNGSVDDDGGLDVTERGFAWGTTSNSTNPGNQAPAASYTDNWTEYDADWGEGDFSHQITGLNLCDIYYYRAYALNSKGWGWGDEQSFTTLCDPDVNVAMASNVAAKSARINALVHDDGGQACDVRFCYGTSSGNCTDGALGCPGATCNCTTYDTTTAWVENTYLGGDTPYADLTDLLTGTTYYYCVQIRNDVSCRCGGEMTFATETGVYTPTEFVSSPTSSTISLLWVKGVGTQNTLVRVSTAAYPSVVTEGTAIYGGTGNSYLYSGLSPGTTHYFSAWGLSGGVYSGVPPGTGYATTMATTLAAGAADVILPTPPTPTEWSAEPSVAGISDIPFFALVNYFADEYSMPQATMWYGLSIMFSIGAGFFIYWRGNKNLLAAIITVAIGLFIGAVLGLVYLWVGVFFCVIAISMAWMAQRY